MKWHVSTSVDVFQPRVPERPEPYNYVLVAFFSSFSSFSLSSSHPRENRRISESGESETEPLWTRAHCKISTFVLRIVVNKRR